MNWEELAAAHDDQTPLVWSPSDADFAWYHVAPQEIVAVYRSNKRPFPMPTFSHEYGRVWVVRAGGHQVDVGLKDLRPATAQDLLELAGEP